MLKMLIMMMTIPRCIPEETEKCHTVTDQHCKEVQREKCRTVQERECGKVKVRLMAMLTIATMTITRTMPTRQQ